MNTYTMKEACKEVGCTTRIHRRIGSKHLLYRLETEFLR